MVLGELCEDWSKTAMGLFFPPQNFLGEGGLNIIMHQAALQVLQTTIM